MDKKLFQWLQEQPCVALVSNESKQWTIQPAGEVNLEFQFKDTPPIIWCSSQDEAILNYYEIEEGDLEELKRKIDAAIQKMVERKVTNGLYWDYNDSLDTEQIKDLVENPDALWELEDELTQNNCECLDEQRKAFASEILNEAGVDDDHPCEGVLMDYTLEALSEEIPEDANVRDLMKRSNACGFTVQVDGAETQMQGWQGIRDLEDVERICEVLNVSPNHLQDLVAAEDLVLPTIPERDGNELITIGDLKDIYVNSIYGGLLVFMITLDLAEWILDGGREEAKEHGITIEKGTRVVIHDYMNGATGGEGLLTKDLVLAPGTFTLGYDLGRKYGIQSCCDYTKSAWDGSIKVNKPDV